MFRLYIVRALELTKGDTYIITVNHESKREKKTIQIGHTHPVKDDRTNNYWLFDEEHEHMIFYPFVDSDDSKIFLSVYKIGVMKSKKLMGTATFELNKILYEDDFEIPIDPETDPGKANPRVFVYVETFFGHMLNKVLLKAENNEPIDVIKEKNKILKTVNFLYVYLENPRNALGKTPSELQIYECNPRDGGYSNLIGRTTPKKSENKKTLHEIIIKKENFKASITRNGCSQLYYFNVNELIRMGEFLYLPLIRINSEPGNYIINYALYSFNYFPTLIPDKDGNYDFSKLGIKPFKPHLIQQDVVYCPSTDLFTGTSCFGFCPSQEDPTKYEFKSYRVLQDHQDNLSFDDFAKNIRMRLLPNVSVFKRLIMSKTKLYSLKKIAEFHQRMFLIKIKINLSWRSKADLDLSLCVLNKNQDCIGHVSFKDHYFFDNKSIKHAKPFREEARENGGFEEVSIKMVKLPHQAKTILIVITSYKKTPFNKISPAPIIRMFDDTNKQDLVELMFYKLSSISAGTGVLFAALQRAPNSEWYFVPLEIYCNESKPYDAHRVLIEKIKAINPIEDFIKRHQNDVKDD
ncbi:hypothetical protein M9Y10_009016 [Tritrichomonas musculus]|uniref:TerD domain-containing protein n=1 Tax=Tritrichomonas musculus TaxID=1915356 RepID=A0ABR2J0U9_9EUKA